MKRKNMMLRNLQQTIKKSLGRYIAIVAIIALGAGLFCGLRVTTVDMVATVQRYTDKLNMFDIRVQNPYGWTDANVSELSKLSGIADAEGSYALDVLVTLEGTPDEIAYKVLSIPETVNRIELTAGRMPDAPDECLLDDFTYDESMIGQTITIAGSNTDTVLDGLAYDSYTVVGLCSTPLYINMQRGSTSIGNGSLTAFLYIPVDGFSLDVYTEISLTLDGEYRVYTDDYDDAMDAMAERLEEVCAPLVQQRYEDVLAKAQESYDEGMREYLDGLAEFEEAKSDALTQLGDAEQQLLDAEAELKTNRTRIEDGLAQIETGQAQLDEGLATLAEARVTLAETRSSTYSQLSAAYSELLGNYQTVLQSQLQIESGLSQIQSGITQIESYQDQIKTSEMLLDIMIPVLETALETARDALDSAASSGTADPETLAELEAKVEELQAKYDEYVAQQATLEESKVQLESQLAELKAQQAELQANKDTLDAALVEIELGFMQLEQAQLDAENQFAAAEAKLDANKALLELNQAELDKSFAALTEGQAALEEGEAELADAWEAFHKEKETALRELADAEAELADAALKLADAKEAIAELEPGQVYALTRNTNNGYVVFENDANIVDGVAEIFPVFFLAVAALVCITTMTRMVDEERTQIGITKALGYSRGAIMFKYMGYSGSAALMGCFVGMIVGSVIFPYLLWDAYCIMYCIPQPLEIRFDWDTIGFIVVSYTALTLLVTWYCCRRELQNVPAELMRPKAPAAGKKVFLEKLPIWKKLKFLDKVAIRNIFRYRQRLAMMMLGIGGCTALLVTGFGIKDSIMDIVDYQYERVTVYDISLTFSDDQTEEAQDALRREVRGQSDRILYCYQGAIDVTYDGITKDINFLVSDQDLRGFVDLKQEDAPIAMPGLNEAVLSCGTANALDVQVGDSLTLYNGSEGEMTVTVSGIFDNYVWNYVIISGDTMRAQWGHDPELTTAFVVAGENQDVYQLGSRLADFDDVAYVAISQDTKDIVGGMLEALNSIIVVIVLCAGLLAGIVLYNLTNINIKERIREIATIKVLGFRAGETASYVFKENLALTALGTAVGLFAGKYLHALVMSYVRIDMVWFDNRILWYSYIFSAILTIVPALLVDFIMYFQLDKINMAEALKSVE